MNLFKALFVAVFCVPLTFVGFSQTEDNCASKRWISVKNSDLNKELFFSLPDILEEVQKQTKENTLYGNRESEDFGVIVNDKGDRITRATTAKIVQSDIPLVDDAGNPIILTLEDGTKSFRYDDPVITDMNNDVPLVDNDGNPIVETLGDGQLAFIYPTKFDFSIQSDVPLVDNTGDPIVVTMEDGTQSFLYPTEGNYLISQLAIYELRFVEERVFDKETNAYTDEFKVTNIGFCMNMSSTKQERIWFNLDQFFENMESPESHPWYSLIKEGNYSGFKYKQTPCSDK